MGSPDSFLNIENIIECLRADETIDVVFRKRCRVFKIADNSGSSIALNRMKDIKRFGFLTCKFPAVVTVTDLKDPAPDKMGIFSQKILYVVAIDRGASIETENSADRVTPFKIIKMTYFPSGQKH
jgi:hypothetical protein